MSAIYVLDEIILKPGMLQRYRQKLELRYLKAAAFDDRLEVWIWLDWVRHASLRMCYEVRRGDVLLASGATDHAMVDGTGRVRGIPKERREGLGKLTATP